MNVFQQRGKRGFTLIELMTVMAIIGILATLVFAALQEGREKGRDSQRVQSLKELQKAVELYYADYGYYPQRNTARSGSASNVCFDGTRGDANWCGFISDLAPYYKGGLKDPNGDTQTTYRFIYDSDPGDSYTSYGLMTRLENGGSKELADSDGGVFCATTDSEGNPCGNTSLGHGFEIGDQPRYCRSQGQSNWWSSNTTVCP